MRVHGQEIARLRFAEFRRRTVYVASIVAWITIASVLLLTLLHDRHTERSAHVAIWSLLALAAAFNLLTYSEAWRRRIREAESGGPFYLWTAALVLLGGVLLLLSGDLGGQVYLLYLPAILFAFATLNAWGQVLTLALTIGSYSVVLALSAEVPPTSEIVMQISVFGAVALMGAFISREQRTAMARQAVQEAAATARAYELAVLNEASLALSSELRLEGLLRKILELSQEVVGAEWGALLLRNDQGRWEYHFRRAANDGGGDGRLGAEGWLLSRVLEASGPLRLSGLDAKPRDLGLPECCSRVGSLLAIPLRRQDEVVGGLVLINREDGRAFELSDEETAVPLATQAGIAIENALLYEQIRQKEERLRELLGKVISAQEDERMRISRELHDQLGQTLSTAIMSLGAAEEGLAAGSDHLSQRLGAAKELLVEGLEEIRRLILNLRPTVLDDLGLIPALRWYAKTYLETQGIAVDLRAHGFRERLAPELELTLFRILQEAMNNIARHSGASTAQLDLELSDGRLSASISDDGAGFDSERMMHPSTATAGLGLLGMRERAGLFGGTLVIDSAPGKGTHVRVDVPLKAREQVA